MKNPTTLRWIFCLLGIMCICPSGLFSQSFAGTWKGSIIKKGELYSFEIKIDKDHQAKNTKIELGMCFALMKAPRISFDREHGTLKIQEGGIARSNREGMVCSKTDFASKTLVLYPFVGTDKSYLILQGTFTGWGGGYVYLYRKSSPAEADNWRMIDRNKRRPQQLAQGPMIFDDYFNKGRWRASAKGADFQLRQNVLSISSSEGTGTYFQPIAEEMPMSFDLETEFRLTDYPHRMNVRWGAQDASQEGTSYQLGISYTQLTIHRVIDGKRGKELCKQDVSHLLGMFETNQIRVRKVLNEVTYYVNGKEVFRGKVEPETGPMLAYMVKNGKLVVNRLKVHSLDEIGPQLVIREAKYLDQQENQSVVGGTPGMLEILVANTGQLDAPSLIFSASTSQETALGTPQVYRQTGTIPAGMARVINLVLEPSAQLQDGEANFEVALSVGGESISRKTLSVPTENFFQPARSSKETNPRQPILEQFFGTNQVHLVQAKAELEQRIQAGDRLAEMWKAVFMWEGGYGYPHSPTEAHLLAKELLTEVYDAARTSSAEGMYLLSQLFHMEAAIYQAESFREILLSKACEANYGPALLTRAQDRYQLALYRACLEDLTLAREAGMSRAAYLQGLLYEKGLLNGVPDLNSAVTTYQEAAALSDPHAQLALATLSYNPAVLLSGNAVSWTTAANEQGVRSRWQPLGAEKDSDITLENHSGSDIQVAFYYKKDGYWKTVGWIKVPANRSKTLNGSMLPHENPNGAEQLYYFAYGGGERWTGNQQACIMPEQDFLIIDGHASFCPGSIGFQRADRGDKGYVIPFKTRSQRSREQAADV